MTQRFSERVFKRVEPLWHAYLEHPFVKGIGEGTVDEEKFKHYMRQDYVYLIEYSRIFAIGATKAHNLETMTIFSKLLYETMNYEMDLHRQYAENFGISNDELEATEPSATVIAYTSYMLNKAQIGGIENVIAAVLACAWSYNFIGKELATWPHATEHDLYGNWVKCMHPMDFPKLPKTASIF